jgi:hypothetical protein
MWERHWKVLPMVFASLLRVLATVSHSCLPMEEGHASGPRANKHTCRALTYVRCLEGGEPLPGVPAAVGAKRPRAEPCSVRLRGLAGFPTSAHTLSDLLMHSLCALTLPRGPSYPPAGP